MISFPGSERLTALADPYLFPMPLAAANGGAANIDFTNSAGRVQVDRTLDPTKKNCVLLILGQSMAINSAVSLYAPTNATAHQFNVYDGGTYKYAEPQLGCNGTTGAWPGRLADKLITATTFDRVIIANIASGSTSVADWATGNLNQKLIAACKRLVAAQLTPAAVIWQQGVQDGILGTTSANYQSRFATVLSTVTPFFPTSPWFVATETWNAGTVNATIQGAQAALVNHAGSPPIWAGANEDSLNATNRQADITHWNDTGSDANATLWQNALHAYGLPF